MSYLLDTNVLSELRKRRPHPGVRDWVESARILGIFISVLVLGEVRSGVERIRPRDPGQAAALETWLAHLKVEFGDRTLPITAAIAEEWGRINVSGGIPVADGLMAATARVHGLTLVTRNGQDFAATGIPLLDPFVDG